MWSTIEQRDINVLWKHYVSTSIKGKITPMVQSLLTQELTPGPQGLEKSTRNQSQNTEWFKYRASRTIAFQMHRIVKRNKQINEELLNSLFQSCSNFKTAAT